MKTLSIAVLAALLLFSGTLILRHRRTTARMYQNAAIQLKETSVYAMFGLFMWVEAALLCWKMTGSDFMEYPPAFQQNILVFLIASVLLGSFAVLNYFVKTFYIDCDKIVYVSAFGKVTEYPWTDIKQIKVTQQSQRIKLFFSETKSISVTGEKQDFKTFLQYAMAYIPDYVDKAPLSSLRARYKI